MSASAKKIRVSIIEDDSEERELYAAVVQQNRNMECVSKHPSAAHALHHIPQIRPDVILVDVVMPQCSGIECVRQLKKILPKTQFLMLTKHVDDDFIFESYKAGAVGYLVKAGVADDLPALIRRAQRDGVMIPPEIGRQMLVHFQRIGCSVLPEIRLTLREEEVLRLIMQGHSSKEIADRLGCTANTVDRHAQHICEKLHVSSRFAAANKYFRKT